MSDKEAHMLRMLNHQQSLKESKDMSAEPEVEAPHMRLQSRTIGKLAEALAKAQGDMKAPPKSKTMKIPGRGDYKYADLADVIESRRVGAKYGLAITQGMEMRECLLLTTMLMHASGEWKAWECPIPGGLKPQELGSYLTYLRRYSESAAWGLAAEDDDDGQRAQDAPTTSHANHAPPVPQPIGADAAAILDIAAELEQHVGKPIGEIIEAESAFKGRDGSTQKFNDADLIAGKVHSVKWLQGVRAKLEKQLRGYIGTEPGAAEAAELFTDTVKV